MVTPNNHPDGTKVNPAATEGQNSVLPWEISIFPVTITGRDLVTGLNGYGEVSRGHSRSEAFRTEGLNSSVKEQSETIR